MISAVELESNSECLVARSRNRMAKTRGQCDIQNDREADHVGPPILVAALAGSKAEKNREDGYQHRGARLNGVTQIHGPSPAALLARRLASRMMEMMSADGS